jgi:cytochrome c-type biogenesis protein CcmH/NrfG
MLCLPLLISLLGWVPVQAQQNACDPNEDYAVMSSNAFFDGNYEEALAAANCLIELNPGDAYGYALQGDAYRELGDLNAALDSYTTAIEIEPTYDGPR